MKKPSRPTLQAYRVNLSKGDPMPFDTDEMDKVILAIKTGEPCRLRSGIFNPSYYVSITEDRERIAEVERENSVIQHGNEHVERYGDKKNYQKYKKMTPIKDIFAGVDLGGKKTLQATSSPKIGKEAPKKEEGGYRPM